MKLLNLQHQPHDHQLLNHPLQPLSPRMRMKSYLLHRQFLTTMMKRLITVEKMKGSPSLSPYRKRPMMREESGNGKKGPLKRRRIRLGKLKSERQRMHKKRLKMLWMTVHREKRRSRASEETIEFFSNELLSAAYYNNKFI